MPNLTALLIAAAREPIVQVLFGNPHVWAPDTLDGSPLVHKVPNDFEGFTEVDPADSDSFHLELYLPLEFHEHPVPWDSAVPFLSLISAGEIRDESQLHELEDLVAWTATHLLIFCTYRGDHYVRPIPLTPGGEQLPAILVATGLPYQEPTE